MTADLLASLALFALVTSVTPGPNNMMLMSSGLTYGFQRTIPHMLGVAIGFTLMVFAVGLGLGALFEAFPKLYAALKIISIVYLLWLAWKIANSGPLRESGAAAGQPMTFVQAAAFQWINPKAWVMAVTAIAAYVPKENFLFNMVIVSLVFGIVNLPSVGVWTLFGNLLRRYLGDARMVHKINIAMALALVASIIPLLAEFAG